MSGHQAGRNANCCLMTEGVCMGITGKVGSIRRPMVARAEELTGMQAMAARIACQQMTAPAMKLLLDRAEQASSLPTRPGWERKAAAHAEFFRLLADVAGDRAAGAHRPGLAHRRPNGHSGPGGERNDHQLAPAAARSLARRGRRRRAAGGGRAPPGPALRGAASRLRAPSPRSRNTWSGARAGPVRYIF